MISDIDWHTIGLLSVILFLFGILYNNLVGWMEDEGYAEGYVHLLVVLGVIVTLGAVALIDWQAALLALWAFACSGIVMLVGYTWRSMCRRKHGQDEIRKE